MKRLRLFSVSVFILLAISCSGGKGTVSPDLSAYPDTPFTIKDSSGLIGGPLAQGSIGDVLLENDRIRVIIRRPSKNAGIFSFGGIIIDADRIRQEGEAGRDEFGSLFPMVNVEWTINYHDFEVTSTGEDGSPKILRARGTIDVYDYLDLDFVSEVAQGVAGQPIAFSHKFDDRANPFEIYDDLNGVDAEVVTEYRLDSGKNYVRIDTTFKNNGGKDAVMPVGEIINGSGELNLLIPGIGFGPKPMVQATADAPALVYSGFDGVDVSYGYFYDLSQFTDKDGERLPSGSLTFAGVTFLVMGESILKVLPLGQGSPPQINFQIPANSSRTITRYFVVGDGSASSVMDAGMEAIATPTRLISGTVNYANGDPAAGAGVSVQKDKGGTVTAFRTDASGRFSGRLAVSGPFALAFGDGKYHVIAEKEGYHKNGTNEAGECNPKDINAASSSEIEIQCTLGETGFVKFSSPVTDAAGKPIAARLTIIGSDPSPEGDSAGNFIDISEFKKPFGIVDVKYITGEGTIGLTGKSSFALEPGVYRFVFSHGTEYGIVEKDVTVEANKTITLDGITVARAVLTPGFISADFHMHNFKSPDSWISPEKRVLAAAAEGMDVMQSSDHDYLFDYGPVVEKMISARLIPEGSFVASVIGDEITPNQYGHVHAFPLSADASSVSQGAIDWTASPLDEIGTVPDYCMSPKEISKSVREKDGKKVVQINHISDSPSGMPVASGWVTSRFYLEDGAPPLSSFADPVERRLTPATNGSFFPLPYGTSGLVSDDFTSAELVIGFEMKDAQSKFMESTLPTWFNFLNLGMILTATGSSDSHDETSNPMGLPRNFIASSVDPQDKMDGTFNPDDYANAINEHKVVVSAGPFVSVEAKGANGETRGIGDMVSGKEIKLKITASAASWAWFDTIEVYTNTEPIPIDDETKNAMTGTAENAATFYKPYHIPEYAYAPTLSYRLYDATLATSSESNGVITANVETTLNVSEDTWVVVLVRGTKDTPGFKSLFPIITDVISSGSKEPKTFDPLNLSAFHADEGVGAFAFALANPIFIDADGDGAFTAKYVKEGTSPL